ncbi:MAG: DUF4388 domain-containing protein [Deltaproteobacteria bacterium]|nr:DUF4388 domain-containing protein [Deltaproteobacteria bacterium]
MALTGTLKDFGIADILQLIGQQGKTGVLHLRHKENAVNVHFVDGNVVKAESATRSKKDLLGSIMVRAEILDQEQLDRALELQRQTLRRLGDILVDEGMVTRELFREMYQLQTTETLYRLFHWKDGTYEFEQGEVDYDKEAISPIRSENVLMEGFRMVDEWPMVRKKITSYDMTFNRLKMLPGAAEEVAGGGQGEESFDDDLDAAFGEMESGGSTKKESSDFGDLGAYERKIFTLAEPGRTVQDIIDRSRAGEFETCKSLLNLVEAGYLQGIEPAKKGKPLAGAAGGTLSALRSGVIQVAMGVVVLGLIAGGAYLSMSVFAERGTPLASREGQVALADEQAAHLERALAVYRLEEGRYPEALEVLVKARLLSERDLRYPYSRPWYYQPPQDGAERYTLLPPIP